MIGLVIVFSIFLLIFSVIVAGISGQLRALVNTLADTKDVLQTMSETLESMHRTQKLK
jgi:predicted PurR-regulated permease PerM